MIDDEKKTADLIIFGGMITVIQRNLDSLLKHHTTPDDVQDRESPAFAMEQAKAWAQRALWRAKGLGDGGGDEAPCVHESRHVAKIIAERDAARDELEELKLGVRSHTLRLSSLARRLDNAEERLEKARERGVIGNEAKR